MDPEKIESNLSFLRAKALLDTQITDPGYLITFWRVMGDYYGTPPALELCTPWYKGLEKYLFPA